MKTSSIKEKVEKFLTLEKPSKETLNKMLEIIKTCSDIYYDGTESSPLLDEEYDLLVNHYSKFAEVPHAVQTKDHSKKNKNLIDTQHMFPELVGTLTKTNYVYNKLRDNAKNFDAETVEEWIESNEEFLNPKTKYSFIQTWKIDGNSITISYNDKGEVISALTRGKNGLGSDKTNYFKNRKLPSWFPIEKGDIVGIKYEAIISFANKTKVEEILNNGRTYASPCSLVAGLLNKNDSPQDAINLITLAPINIQYMKNKITRIKALELISDLHNKESKNYPISIIPDTHHLNIEKDNYKGIIKRVDDMYQKFIDRRPTLPFPVDGLVFEFIDEDIRTNLGRKSDKNLFEFALKFPYDTKRSHVKDIEFYVSNNGTGRVTPVVVFDDVRFSRAVCNHVSIANYKRFKELKLAKGDEIIVSYHNDTLAYVTLPEDYVHVGKPIKFISTCPYCGEKLKVNEEKTFVHCRNKKCPAIKIGKYNNYLIKIGVDNVRENTIRDLYNAGLLKGLSSLYKLTVKDIIKIDGYQETSAQNIINDINAKKEVYDYELLGALGFTNISTSTCKEICKKFSLSELKDILNDDFNDMALQLLEVNGVAEKTVNQFEKDFSKNLKTIENLEKFLTIKEIKNSISKTNEPKNIVFTGFRDKDIQNKLEMAGHSVKSSVSGKTHIVVTAQKGSGSIKEKKAYELGLPVYSLDEFKSDILAKLLGE